MKSALAVLAMVAGVLGAVPRWGVEELEFTARANAANPYVETQLRVEFRGPNGVRQTVDGFWDGGKTFRVRFAPQREGDYVWRARSSDAGMNGRAGKFTVKGTSGPGFLRVDAAHPFHFVRDDGSRYFMMGQTYYEILATVRQGGKWKEAVDGSLSRGMNKFRFRMHIKTCGNRENPTPCAQWWDGDKDHLDLAHFRAADELVRYLEQKGAVADLMPFDSAARAFGSVEQDRRFLDYVVARYAAYPSVIWCVTNEYQRAGREKKYLSELGAYLRGKDPYLAGAGGMARPLSIHPLGGLNEGDRFHFGGESWPTHVILQIGRWTPGDGRLYPVSLANREFGKPVVNDEFGYIGDADLWRGPEGTRGPKTNWYAREHHRTSMWAAVMAGGYVTTGDKTQYEDGKPYKSSLWHDTAEYGDVAALVQLFTGEGLEYWRMTPAPGMVVDAPRVYALGVAGEQYVLYAAAGGRFRVTLPGKRFRTMLYDPRTGERKELPEVAGKDNTLFVLPEGGDWAVVLRAL